jgi:NAD-dependent SIR2 family protein deacetylase
MIFPHCRNVDGLEAKAGLDTGLPSRRALKGLESIPRCIPLHGTLEDMYCTVCHHSVPISSHLVALSSGSVVKCSDCKESARARAASGKRERLIGELKPNIVLYNEEHPHCDTIGAVMELDLMGKRPDLLLVVGTTLKIPGTRKLVVEMEKVLSPVHSSDVSTPIRTIYLNTRDFPTPQGKWEDVFSVWVDGDVQVFTALLEEEEKKADYHSDGTDDIDGTKELAQRQLARGKGKRRSASSIRGQRIDFNQSDMKRLRVTEPERSPPEDLEKLSALMVSTFDPITGYVSRSVPYSM